MSDNELEKIEPTNLPATKTKCSLPSLIKHPYDTTNITEMLFDLNLTNIEDIKRTMELICKEMARQFFIDFQSEVNEEGTISLKTSKLGSAVAMNLTRMHKIVHDEITMKTSKQDTASVKNEIEKLVLNMNG